MKKKRIYQNYIYGVILTVVIISIIPPVLKAIRTSGCIYQPTFKNQGRFYYLFKDKTEKNFNTVFSVGRSQKGWIYSYIYKKEFRITIWQVLNIKNPIKYSFVLRKSDSSFKIKDNPYSFSDIGPIPVIRIENKNCLNLTKKVSVYFRGKVNYVDTLKIHNFWGFQGELQEINFLNSNNDCQLRMYPLENTILTNLLVLKNNKSIIFIFVNPIGRDSFVSDPVKLFDLSSIPSY